MAHKENNVLTLKEWLSLNNVNKDQDLPKFEKLFYNIDLNMKKLHENGYYITNFNINNILISDNNIKFQDVKKLYYEDRNVPIHKNIFYLSCLAIGVYNDCLNYINPENSRYLKENFNEFSTFIPEGVVPYYKGIIERDATVYLSDYVKAKVARDKLKNQSLLESSTESNSSNNTNTNNKSMSSYTKSTLIGRLYADDNNKAAFIQIILFPVIIIFLSILIPILIILSG